MLIKNITNLLTKNLPLKVLSLFLAFVIFIGVNISNSEEVIQNLEFDISFSIPNNHMIVNKVSKKISIVVKGPLNKINELKKESISISRRVTESKTVFLTENNISELKNIHIVQIIPRSIDVVIEEITTKKVPIQFNIINELPAGYKYELKPKINKEFVVVEGPKSSIDLLSKIYSEPLNQANIIGSESKLLKLKLENSNLKLKDTREISVSYKIVEEFIDKEIKDIKVKFLNCNLKKNNIKPLKDKVSILVRLPYSLKDKFAKKDFFIYADVKNCNDFKRLTVVKLSPAVPHRKILIKYISPDTIILKREITDKKLKELDKQENKQKDRSKDKETDKE